MEWWIQNAVCVCVGAGFLRGALLLCVSLRGLVFVPLLSLGPMQTLTLSFIVVPHVPS